MVVASTSSATGDMPSALSTTTAPASVVWLRRPCSSISTMGNRLAMANMIRLATVSGRMRRCCAPGCRSSSVPQRGHSATSRGASGVRA
ncbi:hypothetical protein D9M72_230020 [compost metagenome]